METRLTLTLQYISAGCLYLIVFLVPLFWLPFTLDQLELNKHVLFYALTLLAAFCFFARAVLLKTLVVRRTPLDISLCLLWLVLLAGSIISQDRLLSFWGDFSSLGNSFISLTFLFIFYFLVMQYAATAKQVAGLVYTLLASGAVAAVYFLFQTAKLAAFPGWLGAPSFNTAHAANTLWGVFLIVIFILALALLAAKDTSAARLASAGAVVLLTGLALALIGFKILWIILAATLFVMLVLFLTYLEQVRVAWFTLVFGCFVAALLFVFWRTPPAITARLPVEVSLSNIVSWRITGETVTSGIRPFMLGNGLGTFPYLYSRFRPEAMNANFAWNVRFNEPFSSALEWLATAGVLGSLLLIAVLLLIIGIIVASWLKHAALFKARRKMTLTEAPAALPAPPLLFWGVVSGWVVLAISLWVVNFGLVHWLAFWLLTALLIAAAAPLGRAHVTTTVISLKTTPQYALVTSFSFIVTLTALLVFGVYLGRFYAAEALYAKSLTAPLDAKPALVQRATELNPERAVFFLTLSDIALTKAAEAARNGRNAAEVVQQLSTAVAMAKRATEIAPANVTAWEFLSTMYASARPLAPEANSWVAGSLEQAILLEPSNPLFQVGLGTARLIDKNYPAARGAFERAIALKPDLLQAYTQLALAHELSNNMDGAISALEKGLPYGGANNAEYLMQLGRYYINRRKLETDLPNAELALRQAIALSPDYADAMFALAFLYETAGHPDAALPLYKKVLELNPKNKDVARRVRALSPPAKED